ncbi:MAG: type I polyketide synthase, partial [Sneathiella sp.]|nr:type I polyketide synthase [Sneathiella sp.]
MKKSKASTTFTGNEIAIVGSSIRLPNGCDNLDDYWRVLVNGEDLITEVSSERWNVDAYYYPERDIPGKAYTKAAGQLDNIWDFDASFFNISPREAAQLDPQQRLLLELSWEAFENAGVIPSTVRGSDANVFIGISSIDYGNTKISDLASGNSFFMLGTTMSIASNRLSYFYDLHGSSLSVDTACSSSLYALDLACQKIRLGESDMAICGGVSVLLTPYPFVGFSQANMLSEDGRCMAFDSRGNGYVRSEGGGILVLKRLSKALEDGNPIHAIVAGVGTNADGRTNGISLPSSDRQEELLRKVYKSANIPPEDVTYLEAHGTGTIVGDAAEVGAIGRFFGPHRDKELLIGSAKSNAGHLEAGSGMAGLIKATLVVKNGIIPKSLHVQKQRDDIPFDEYRIKVATETTSVENRDNPIVVGVNSFGFGGANGHAILKEYQLDTKVTALPLHKTAKGGAGHLPPLLLSARSEISLAKLAEKYLTYLENVSSTKQYVEIASAAVHYRESFENRLAVTGKNLGDIKSSLTAYLDEASPYQTALTGQADPDPKPITFVFNGNGAQYPGMAKDLIVEDPTFKLWITKIDTLIQEKAGWSIIESIEKADSEEISDTMIAQPLIMAIQIALVEYLASFGVHPTVSLGHSVGEIAAAYSAGILSLDQAVDVILKRSNAQGKTRGVGTMAAMEVKVEEAKTL